MKPAKQGKVVFPINAVFLLYLDTLMHAQPKLPSTLSAPTDTEIHLESVAIQATLMESARHGTVI